MDRAPIRVCFIFAGYGIGGTERSMLRLMEHSDTENLDCQVILMGQDNLAFGQELIALGLRYHKINATNLIKLHQILRHDSPDIVYLFGNIRTIGWAIIAQLSAIRVIVIAERSIPVRSFDIWGRRLEKFLVDAFITNSKAAAKVLQERCGIKSERLHVIYNGIDTNTVSHEVETEQIDILCVANLRPLKGHLILLQAIKQLQSKYINLKATLLGKDLTNGHFFEQVQSMALEDTFVWIGFVTDISPYLARAKILVLPSLEREGTPTSILEAMNAGIAVVTSNVGGVSELVQDGIGGYLVKPGDVDALADRIDFLLSHPDDRAKIGENAKRYVRQNHSINAMTEQHLQIFRQLL